MPLTNESILNLWMKIHDHQLSWEQKIRFRTKVELGSLVNFPEGIVIHAMTAHKKLKDALAHAEWERNNFQENPPCGCALAKNAPEI
jgi:hypothetical protein